MIKWERCLPLEVDQIKGVQKEKWILSSSSGEKEIFEMDIKIGKQMNLISLKSDVLNNFKARVKEIKESRNELFQDKNTEEVLNCPVCGISSKNSEFKLEIYGAKYHKCKNCSHLFIIRRPIKQSLEEFYSKNQSYQATYSDKKTAELRVEEIANPKLDWIIEQFKKVYGREPHSILDVGAGSGHFVYACKKRGIEAEGLEISESGIEFAKQIFGIDIKNLDFIKNWKQFQDFDIITFWGVVEHVPNPSELLNAANKAVKNRESLIIVEVPRFGCFSTKIQEIFPENIVRHLDPLGHINIFSDNSLATILYQNNFAPCAAWYFGMDSYELFVQLSNLINDQSKLEILKRNIPALQKAFDLNRFCDDIIVAAKPFIKKDVKMKIKDAKKI